MKGEFDEALASTLLALRKRRGLSLREVQERTGVSNAYLSQIEQGKRGTPTLTLLTKLARAYGISIPQLLNRVEKRSPSASLARFTSDANYVAATFERLSSDRQTQLLEYLKYLETSEHQGLTLLKRGRHNKSRGRRSPR